MWRYCCRRESSSFSWALTGKTLYSWLLSPSCICSLFAVSAMTLLNRTCLEASLTQSQVSAPASPSRHPVKKQKRQKRPKITSLSLLSGLKSSIVGNCSRKRERSSSVKKEGFFLFLLSIRGLLTRAPSSFIQTTSRKGLSESRPCSQSRSVISDSCVNR